ncbi:MAG: hypothetical protein FWD06_09765 [Oscillospiraceae bacterium]|nr:hypothetical protein [Oscillospiraceae bacterium]
MKHKTMKSTGKELFKVVAIATVAVGLFSAAVIGANSLAFAAATNQTTLSPITTSALGNHQEDTAFASPTLALVEGPWQQYHVKPASAMPMEQAAQAGAQYIWDIFGTCIDGAVVEMNFSAHPSNASTWWRGNADVSGQAYHFIINGITGERIDISSWPWEQTRRAFDDLTPEELEAREAMRTELSNARRVLIDSGWFEMDLDQRMTFAGLSAQALQTYQQTAMDLATQHFNRSNVTEIQLGDINADRITDSGVAHVTSLWFIVTDDTGREATILISTATNDAHFINITTQHNDFIPGFYYIGPGIG